jgi:anthranilate synthase component 1
VTGPGNGNAVPDRAAFHKRAEEDGVIPVARALSADWWTPVQAFRLLARREPNTFLLESVEQGERIGRYSFLGRRPFLIARARGDRLLLEGPEAARHAAPAGPPLAALKQVFRRYRAASRPDLPPFSSGAVGYFGYDTVRWVESLPPTAAPPAVEDDLTLLFLEETACFDHVRRRLTLVVNVRPGEGTAADAAYTRAVERLDAMEAELHAPFGPPDPEAGSAPEEAAAPEGRSNLSRAAFLDRVARAQEYIRAGDIFQVVLSQRFTVPNAADDLTLYRALRTVNPSPYMFLLRLAGWSAVGSSPEPLLRIQGDRMEYRPIAGTIARSGDDAEDARRADILRNDPKEQAEHVMLVDLGRNDLGRCAVSGSVRIEQLMAVERYSHVMHLVSGLTAQLRPGLAPLDALYACFPAGTVTGAPKIRAMEIIQELEPEARGLYAGAVGYIDFAGNLDTCIALRTMIVRPDAVVVPAGAGIVADSDPSREYEETRGKAAALLEAVRRAAAMGGDPR